MIEIIFDPSNSEFSNLSVSLDQKYLDYSIVENKIILADPIDLGMHILRLQLLENNSKVDIIEVKINGASLRQTLFFSFVQQGANRMQPATCVWETSQIWVLPFMNPVSYWIGVLGEKLRKDALGTDLGADYEIFIPEPVAVNNNLLSNLVEFFKFDFDCVILHKDDITTKNLPYRKYPVELNIDGIYDEIYKNIDLLRASIPNDKGQLRYNQKEEKNFDMKNSWFALTTCKMQDGEKIYRVAGPETLPLTYAFVESLNLDYEAVVISVSPPRSYCYVHTDRKAENSPEKFTGCKQLYIPLNYPIGSLIKAKSVGILPEIPIIFNPHYYAHAVVNDSDEARITLSVVYDHKV